jgi:Zn/Cd-binding protein ZinT
MKESYLKIKNVFVNLQTKINSKIEKIKEKIYLFDNRKKLAELKMVNEMVHKEVHSVIIENKVVRFRNNGKMISYVYKKKK